MGHTEGRTARIAVIRMIQARIAIMDELTSQDD